MKKTITSIALCVAGLAVSSPALASEIRYQPINPSFGGNPFNGAYLLGNADAQNDNVRPRQEVDPIENFERTVTNSLLNRISQDITDQILGENAADSGEFSIGDTLLTFNRQGDIVVINIADVVGGTQTTVEVPAPVF